ncbi:ankyrin, partial [Choiromyces venosus 120613-1]
DIVIRTLLEADTDMLIELEEWSEDGRTPLHLAAMYGFTQIVEMLLEREDVDPGFPDVCDMTPLVLAVVGGQEDVVHLLLARGADVNGDLESTSRTPLQAATIYGYVSIVKTLLK